MIQIDEIPPALDDPRIPELAIRLLNAARTGDTPTLAEYLDAGVPSNVSNRHGDSLVMLAAYHGHTSALAVLIDRGADVNRLNAKGHSPLVGALYMGKDEAARLLVAAGADSTTGCPPAIDAAHLFGRTHLMPLLDTGKRSSRW
ncbi:ankyrin repeat domain-containing protein [Rhodococcus koreensis]